MIAIVNPARSKFRPRGDDIKTLLIAILTLAGWTCSLFFTGYHDTIYAPAILLLLAAVLIAVLGTRRTALPKSAPAILLAALWLYITLSLTWSRVPFASLVTWLVFTGLPLTFFAFAAPQGGALPRRLVLLLLAALTILAGWAVIQVTFLSATYGHRAHAPLPDANNLAALLDMGLLPMLALAFHRPQNRKLAWLADAACAVLFAGLLATQSRGGLLCALTAMATLGISLRTVIKCHPRRLLCLLLAAAAIMIAMQIPARAPVSDRLTHLIHPKHDANVMARLAIWHATMKLIAAHPLTGTGFGTFYLYYPSVRPPLLDNSSGNWAHNDPLQFWAECGIAAPVLLYAFLLAVALRSFRAIRRTPPDSAQRAGIAGLAAGLLAAAQHAHIEFDFYILPTLACAGIWLASWHHQTAAALGEPAPAEAAPWRRTLLIAVSLALALPFTLLTASSAAGQLLFERAQASLKAGLVGPFLDNTGRAEKFAPGSFIDPQVALAGFYIDLLSKPSVLFNADDKRKMFGIARDLLDEAGKANPAWAEIDRKRAKLYEAAPPGLMPDAAAAAHAALQTAVAKNPMNFQARQELAQDDIAQGRKRDAYDLLAGGLRYPHDDDVTQTYTALLNQLTSETNH